MKICFTIRSFGGKEPEVTYRGRRVEIWKEIDWYLPPMGSEINLQGGLTCRVAEVIHFFGTSPVVQMRPAYYAIYNEALMREIAYLIEREGWKIR
jgi:hypothetical protein